MIGSGLGALPRSIPELGFHLPLQSCVSTVHGGSNHTLAGNSSASICHAALTAFIDKPNLFRHRNTGFASTCHNLSSIIVVK